MNKNIFAFGFKKNLVIILGLIVILGLAVWIYFFGFPREVSQEIPISLPYNLKDDYCGKQIDIHYCQCAFEGEFCNEVGISNKETAQEFVQKGFDSWLKSQKEQKCLEQGGQWNGQVCRVSP